jgi:dihydroxyacetone kinase-like protein
MEELNIEDFIQIIANISKAMTEKKDYLGNLDAKMGDGDLGITMDKGWATAMDMAYTAASEGDIGKLLFKCGVKMSSVVPSTMGTLMASGLIEAGKALTGKGTMTAQDLAVFFRAYSNGIAKRGKCEKGDRTVLDSILPAAEAAEMGISLSEMAQAASKSSAEGLKNTKKMKPKFGKAVAHAAQAVGVEDQGAAVGFIIVDTICNYITEGKP